MNAPFAPPVKLIAHPDDAQPRAAFNLGPIIEIARHDTAFVRKVLLEIVQNNRSDILRLKASGEAGDFLLMAELAHRIKGIAQIIAANEMAQTCRAVEQAGRSGDDAAHCRKILSELIAQVERLNAELETFEATL